jgi:hypothetical protein
LLDDDLKPPEAIRAMWDGLRTPGITTPIYFGALIGSFAAGICFLILPSTVLALTFLAVPPIAAMLREKMDERERLVWVLVSILLILAVGRGLKNDEKKNQEAQQKIADSFKEIGDGVKTAITQNSAILQQTQASLVQTEKIGQLAEENLENVTGGNSYAYVTPQMGIAPIPLSIYNYGTNTLTGVVVEIIRPSQGLQDFTNAVFDPIHIEVGTLHPGAFGTTGPRILKGYFIDPRQITGIVLYQVRIYSQNFTVTQNLFLRPGVRAPTPIQYRTVVQKQYVKSRIGDTIYYGYETLFQNDWWPKDD